MKVSSFIQLLWSNTTKARQKKILSYKGYIYDSLKLKAFCVTEKNIWNSLWKFAFLHSRDQFSQCLSGLLQICCKRKQSVMKIFTKKNMNKMGLNWAKFSSNWDWTSFQLRTHSLVIMTEWSCLLNVNYVSKNFFRDLLQYQCSLHTAEWLAPPTSTTWVDSERAGVSPLKPCQGRVDGRANNCGRGCQISCEIYGIYGLFYPLKNYRNILVIKL